MFTTAYPAQLTSEVHFLQMYDVIHSHTQDTLCSSGKKEWSVMPRTICTTFSYVAHRDLHPCTGTTGQITISLAWQKQLCLALRKDGNKNSSSNQWMIQTYLTPPFLQLLLLQKMLLRWYRQLKTSPVDQETLTAESVATARNIHSFSHLLPLCPW